MHQRLIDHRQIERPTTGTTTRRRENPIRRPVDELHRLVATLKHHPANLAAEITGHQQLDVLMPTGQRRAAVLGGERNVLRTHLADAWHVETRQQTLQSDPARGQRRLAGLAANDHTDRTGGQTPTVAPPDELEGHVGDMTLPGMQLDAHLGGNLGQHRPQRRAARMTTRSDSRWNQPELQWLNNGGAHHCLDGRGNGRTRRACAACLAIRLPDPQLHARCAGSSRQHPEPSRWTCSASAGT